MTATFIDTVTSKLRRDRHLGLRVVVGRSIRYAWELVTARLRLRAADRVGTHARTLGRPRIENLGRLEIGGHVLIRSVNVPVELCTGPEGTLRIGDGVRINYGSSIAAHGAVTISNRVRIGPYVMVVDTDFHDPYVRTRRPAASPIVIEDDVWIGAKEGLYSTARALPVGADPYATASGAPTHAALVGNLAGAILAAGSDATTTAHPHSQPQAGGQPHTPESTTGPSRLPAEGQPGGGGLQSTRPILNPDGTSYAGPTANPNRLRVSQDWVSPETSDGISISALAEHMRTGGWRGDPLDVIEMPDGGLLSVDNRRIVAARMAGLEEIPVRIRPFTEPFPPPDMAPERARSFILRNAIRRAPDGRMYTGDGPDPIVYPAGRKPSTWGEASLFRTANQGQSIEPGRFPGDTRFPVGGTTETPIIRGPNHPSPQRGGGVSGWGGGQAGAIAPSG